MRWRRGFYQVQYQVVSAGQYHMAVTADGKPLDGSPFAVDVRAPEKPAAAAAAAAAPAAAASTSPPRGMCTCLLYTHNAVE